MVAANYLKHPNSIPHLSLKKITRLLEVLETTTLDRAATVLLRGLDSESSLRALGSLTALALASTVALAALSLLSLGLLALVGGSGSSTRGGGTGSSARSSSSRGGSSSSVACTLLDDNTVAEAGSALEGYEALVLACATRALGASGESNGELVRADRCGVGIAVLGDLGVYERLAGASSIDGGGERAGAITTSVKVNSGDSESAIGSGSDSLAGVDGANLGVTARGSTRRALDIIADSGTRGDTERRVDRGVCGDLEGKAEGEGGRKESFAEHGDFIDLKKRVR